MQPINTNWQPKNRITTPLEGIPPFVNSEVDVLSEVEEVGRREGRIMIKKKKKYYIVEMRYKPNNFLLDEVEDFRSEKKAQRRCERLNNKVKRYAVIVMEDKPFVGKRYINFLAQDIHYTVSLSQ